MLPRPAQHLALYVLVSALCTVATAQQPPVTPPVTPPEIISKQEPAYTPEAQFAGIQGDVVLLVVITAEGTAKVLQVLTSLDKGLDRNAVAAVSTWRFKPAEKEGKPISVQSKINVAFRLKGGAVREVLSKEQPKYTPRTLRNKREGTVRLRLEINPAGEVTTATVVGKLDPVLDDNAKQAALRWRYKPLDSPTTPRTTVAFADVPFSLADKYQTAALVPHPLDSALELSESGTIKGSTYTNPALGNLLIQVPATWTIADNCAECSGPGTVRLVVIADKSVGFVVRVQAIVATSQTPDAIATEAVKSERGLARGLDSEFGGTPTEIAETRSAITIGGRQGLVYQIFRNKVLTDRRYLVRVGPHILDFALRFDNDSAKWATREKDFLGMISFAR